MPKTNRRKQPPKRWDAPFGEHMTDDLVALLLSIEPFSRMDLEAFPPTIPLEGILKFDTRIVDCQMGDIVIREGDYGNSAFMVLEGAVDVCLKSLPPELLGRSPSRKRTFWESLSQFRNAFKVAEVRDDRILNRREEVEIGQRVDQKGETRIFLQDVPRMLDENQRARMTDGEIFGELAALARTPRSATVVASSGKDTFARNSLARSSRYYSQ